MISDIINIKTKQDVEMALRQAQKVADYKELSPKGTLHLRLLAEEMVGIMGSITDLANGKFWIEEKDGEYKLCLQVETALDKKKRQELLANASSGKNEATKSFMGTLREFFFRDADEQIASYNNNLLAVGVNADPARPVTDWQWSLTRYQDNLSQIKEKPDASEAWDELEKSVVKRVADDVKISIKGWQTDMVIYKKLA